ncbi:DapH/DapD/GlmU-related protein [Vibrio amylolyticus]
MKTGPNPSMLSRNIYIAKGNKLSFGYGCRINENVHLEACQIGNDVMIAPNATLLSRMHEHSSVDTPMSLQGYQTERSITVEDDVWIGRNVVIMPGVTIGKGSIVAASAVVTENVPEYSIVAGIPAKIIKKRI